MSVGKVTAQVAQVCLTPADDQFYIFSHPKALAMCKPNASSAVQPADPFVERPEIGHELKAVPPLNLSELFFALTWGILQG
jgi:hypothetical protein